MSEQDQNPVVRAQMQVDDGPIKDISYNEASAQLEAIIRNLEAENVELEESLKDYEQGIKLIRYLQQKLSAAEQKVDVLMGEITPESTDATDTTLS